MVQLFIVLFTLSLSKDLPVKKQLYTESTTGHVISTIGYYDILVRGGETITGILSNGDNRLFLVIPSHLQISIEEIIIDNHPVPEFSDKKGFIINGKENVTFLKKEGSNFFFAYLSSPHFQLSIALPKCQDSE